MANYDLTYEGSRVQGILDTGDELRDAGYIFRGEATPSTVPGTPTERVAYIGGPGTYTNFGSSITVGAGCVCIFKYTGSAWSNQVINTGLSDAISSEATTRSQADTALQNAISAINTKLGEGYIYAGLATPSTNPGTPAGKVLYIATAAGTYTNFGNGVVTAGLNVLKYNGSAWSVDQVIAIDAEPTQGSNNLVKSSGVLNSIIQNGPAFDLSAYNAQGGTLATYADLSAALTALNALPADFKKGGMSMKYVQTSDNKYVQYRLMSDSFNTTVANWQGVDDEPTSNSDNLVKSGGVADKLQRLEQDITRNDISSIDDKIEIIGNSGTKVTEINMEKTVPTSKDKIEVCDDDGDVYSAVKLRTYKNKISSIDIKDDAGKSIFAISAKYSPTPKFEIHKNYYVAKDGSANYSSLSKAIMDAVQKMDSVVYVASGEYNLITEFQEIFGNDFFDNFQDIEYPSFDYHHGLFLMNRIKVVFATGAKVTFPYEGTNAGVNKQFSPFNAGRYGFTLINANVECKNCRYVIHDEMGPNKEPYRNIYEHCILSGDNTDNQHWSGPSMWCIGGGLGRNGDIIFNDCIFKNAERVGNCISLVSYHNDKNENDAQSKVVMTGCYFMNHATFRISALGNSTKMTTAVLSNNRFGREPICERESAGSTTPFNVEIVEWNNIKSYQ